MWSIILIEQRELVCTPVSALVFLLRVTRNLHASCFSHICAGASILVQNGSETWSNNQRI